MPSDTDILWEKLEKFVHDGDGGNIVLIMERLLEYGVEDMSFQLGEFYELGSCNVRMDLPKAINYYKISIDKLDNPQAKIGLGRILYYGGPGVLRDEVQATRYFLEALNSGQSEAAVHLGIINYSKYELNEEKSSAKDYFEIAREQGYFIAYGYLAKISLIKGNYFKAAYLIVKGWLVMVKLLRNDPESKKLLRIAPRRT